MLLNTCRIYILSLLASAKCKMANGQSARCFLLDEKSLPPTNAVPNGWMKVDFPLFSGLVNSMSWPFTQELDICGVKRNLRENYLGDCEGDFFWVVK